MSKTSSEATTSMLSWHMAGVGADRRRLAAFAFLVLAGPALLFPQLVPEGARVPVVLVCIVSALAGAIGLLRDNRRLAVLTGLFGITVGIALLRTPLTDLHGLSHASGLALGLIVMSIVGRYCRTKRGLELGAALFVAGAIAAVLVGLSAVRAETSKTLVPILTDRLRIDLHGLEDGGTVNPNAVGGMAVLVAPLAIAFFLLPSHLGGLPRRSLAVLKVIGVATTVGVLLGSGSRGAWLAALLTTAICMLRVYRRWAARLLVCAALIAVMVSAGAVLWFSLGSERAETAIASAEKSGSFRLTFWRHGLTHVRSAPWFGIGVNQFRYADLPPDENFGWGQPWHIPHAHNIAIQVALDLGVGGCILYILITLQLLVWADHAARAPNAVAAKVAAGAGLSLLAVNLFGLGDAIALGAKVGLFQWYASGLILAAHESAAERRLSG